MRAVWRVWGGLPFFVLMSNQALAVDLPDLPPIRSNGALTYSFQDERQASGQGVRQHTATATISPSTYIYEPWFATTNGTLNFSKTASSGESESSSNNITGALTLSVLPQSDYATELHYSRFDRTIQLSEDSSDLTGQSLRLTNRLILPDEWFVQSRLTHDEASDTSGLGESSNEYAVEVAKKWTEDLLRMGAEHRDSVYSSLDGGEGITQSDSFTLRHRSQPFESLTTDGTTTVRHSEFVERDYAQGSDVMQGVSTAVWKPAEFKDVTVHGALRTFQQKQLTERRNSGTTEQETQTAFGNLSSSYVFEPRLVGNVGLNAGYNESSTSSRSSGSTEEVAVSSLSMGGSAGLDYSSEGETWEDFHWTWFGGNGMDIATSTDQGMMWSDQVRVGHSLSRVFHLGWVDNLNFAVSESSGVGFNSVYGAQIPLSHTSTLSHTTRAGKGWNVWSLTGSDTRSLGGENATTYQLANVQITQGYDPDRFSSISASVTFQASRQISRGSDTGFVDTVNGNITYRERMVFGFENLNFSSDLALNPPSLLQRNRQRDYYYSSNTDPEQEGNVFGTQRWTNRLDHTIGQLRTGLMFRIVNDEDGMDMLTMFQISRRF